MMRTTAGKINPRRNTRFGSLWLALLILSPAGTALAETNDWSHPLSTFPAAPAFGIAENLYAISGKSPEWRGDTTDEDLAAAVSLGNDPSLNKPNPFRKRSIDFFRAERNVVIGRSPMNIRIKVRPKSRETVKIELRF